MDTNPFSSFIKDQLDKKTKKLFRDFIQKEILKEVIPKILFRINNFINEKAEKIVLSKLEEVDASKFLSDKLDKLLSIQMEPIITKSLELAQIRISKRINKELSKVISLKTSTIMEINEQVRKLPIEVEEKSLEILKIEFPEYYTSIKQVSYEDKKVIHNGRTR